MSTRKTAEIKLVSSHPEVYPPCDDSFLLVDSLLSDQTHLLSHNPSLCLEIGSGSGYVLTSLALILGPGPLFLATDINPHALNTTCATLASHGLLPDPRYAFEFVSADVVSGMEDRLRGKVDVLVVNPPYVPTPEDEVGRGGIAAAWAGGENGRSVIDRILTSAEGVLSEKGWMYLVVVEDNDPTGICVGMGKRGFCSRVVLQRSTEEEFLLVIKFWRDRDEVEKDVGDGVVLSLARQVSSRLSFLWRSGDCQAAKRCNVDQFCAVIVQPSLKYECSFCAL